MAERMIDVKGAVEARMILAQGAAKITAALGLALVEEAKLAMRDSLKEVPVKDGVLKASGQVDPPSFSGGRVKVSLGYGGAASAYALYQHNAPSGFNYTKAGTKSHFLSDPVQARVPSIAKSIQRRIGRILGS